MSASLTTLYEQAETYFAQRNFGSAQAAYTRIIEIARTAETDSKLAALSSLQRLAELAVMAGGWDHAIQCLEFASNEFAECGNRYLADYVALRIATVENARGRGRIANQVLERMSGCPNKTWNGVANDLPIWEKDWAWPEVSEQDRAVFFTGYYLEAGRIEAYNGHFERATALFRRGLDWVPVDQTAAQAGIPLCLALTSARLQMGDLRTASLYLEMVPIDLDEQKQLADLVTRLELKARLDLLTGDLGSAKSSLERAMQLCEQSLFSTAGDNAALNLAQVLVFLNQTSRARQLCQNVIDRAESTHHTCARIRASHILSLLTERTQSLANGVSLAPSVTEMWLGQNKAREPSDTTIQQSTPFDIEEAPDYLTLFDERALGFYWHLSRADLNAARCYLDELGRIFQESKAPTDSLLIGVRLHALDCMLAYYEGRYTDALEGLKTLCPYLRDLSTGQKFN